MEFRLVYRGPLPSAGNSNPRAKEKHDIRKILHKQLFQYWQQHPHLKMLLGSGNVFGAPLGDPNNLVTKLGKSFNRGGWDFVPLVQGNEDLFCSLDILFMRHGPPGGLVTTGGDLDNRMKTLIDALRIPNSLPGSIGTPSSEDPNPVFCLLQDDSQITSLKVVTDRLLFAPEPEEKDHHVMLVIHVHVYKGTNVAQVTGLPGAL